MRTLFTRDIYRKVWEAFAPLLRKRWWVLSFAFVPVLALSILAAVVAMMAVTDLSVAAWTGAAQVTRQVVDHVASSDAPDDA